MSKKGRKTAKKKFRPAFGCTLHPKAGRNTQQLFKTLRNWQVFAFYKLCRDNSQKCTPKQIMLYKVAISLHKTFNEIDPHLKTETIRLFEQIICSRRQINFELFRNNVYKIGMNTSANKFYHISKLIGLDKLNLTFVHYKKLMKIQFLKNGKT